jgi:(p)ppGpp synthase/HD superfamily hydrolase
MKLTAKQQLLLNQVKKLHYGQERKYNGLPYWTHPYEVAELLFNNIGPTMDFMIEIAFLHDILEDQKFRCDEIQMINLLKICGYSYFDGMYITRAVIELTDVYTRENCPQMNRELRKEREAERLWNVSAVAQTVKYADLIHNTGSIVLGDPKFAVVYLREKRNILRFMSNGHGKMYELCNASVHEAECKLDL